jgi:hypothetical protein
MENLHAIDDGGRNRKAHGIAQALLQFAKAPRRFSSPPLVYSVLLQPQGSNNAIPKWFTCAWIIWKQCSLDVPHNVDTQCMQSQTRGPTRPFGYHLIPIWNSLLDSHRTVDVQIRFRRTCPINETSVGNDDPNQSHTSLAVCAKWLVIDRRSTRTIHALSARVT